MSERCDFCQGRHVTDHCFSFYRGRAVIGERGAWAHIYRASSFVFVRSYVERIASSRWLPLIRWFFPGFVHDIEYAMKHEKLAESQYGTGEHQPKPEAANES